MPLSLEPTYKQEAGPPSSPFAPYKRRIEAQLRELSDSDCSEPDLQSFLEQHPSLVPGAWTPGTKSGHPPLYMALISQPPLNGAAGKRPDFMWISMHSGAWYAALVEIESPSKALFRRNGTPTAMFSQARNQLAEWRTWFNDPTNIALFVEDYGIPDKIRRSCQFHLHLILIYGRRKEFEGKPKMSKQRGSLLTGPNEELMSFDRLSADPELCDAVSVRLSGRGRFRLLHVPETFGFWPDAADELHPIDGWEEAIDANPRMRRGRKAFLKKRFHYWRDWSAAGGVACSAPVVFASDGVQATWIART